MAKLEEILDNPARLEALDATKSFIVQAPAGSGKTTLLAKRYLELLSRVGKPEEILAITFTKKAANEMRARILELLDQRDPSIERALQMNMNRGWQIQENPNRLKILTIDALAYEIAKQSVGESNYQDHAISESPALLYRLAAERLLERLYDDDPLATPIANFLEFCSNDFERACRMIVTMLAKRDQWLEVSQIVINESFNSKKLEQHFNNLIKTLNQEALSDVAQRLDANDRAKASMIAPNDDLISALPSIVQAITTQSGGFRKRLTIKDHPNFSDKTLKNEIVEWIGDLDQRDLLTDFLTIRNLPKELIANDVQAITDACICVAMAAAELEKVMEDKKEVDFPGIAMCAQSSLTDSESPTDLALQLGYRFQHLLIDEFQDTSRSQIRFFKTLMESWNQEDGQTFFAVGDPMQSIYSFRDADVSVFLEIQKEGLNQLPVKSIKLSSNFRSDPKIVEWINKLFSAPVDHKNQQLLGGTSQTISTSVLPGSKHSNVQSLEFDYFPNEIEKILSYITEVDNGLDSIGILCRSRNHLSPLLESMNEHSIAWRANDFYSLENEPLIRDLLAIQETIYSNMDKLSWMTILRSPLFGLSLVELERISRHDDIAKYIRRQAEADARFGRLNDAYQWAITNRFEFPLREVLEGIWIRLGGVHAYGEEGITIALAFFDLVDELSEGAHDIEQLRHSLSSLHSPPTSKKTNIQVMTIHKAKGLEFDHVIVPFLDRHTRNQELPLLRWSLERQGLMVGVKNDSIYEWLNYKEKQKSENESKRLLYVALTRARKTLFCSYTKTGTGNPTGLAKFLEKAEVTKIETEKPNVLSAERRQRDIAPTNTLRHLPKDFKWKPPKDINLSLSPIPEYKKSEAIESNSTFEMAVGVLVHQSLSWLTQNRDQSIADLEPIIRLWSRNQYSDNQTNSALSGQVNKQIKKTLGDKKGRWILSPHQNEVSEFGLTGIVDGAIQRVFVDRMFIEDGIRWIIDYKSGTPEEAKNEKEFCKEQIARHKHQLKSYHTIASNLYPEKIKTAMFFTAIAVFKEVTV